MQTRRIGPFTVPAIGMGCMNLHWGYGSPVPDARGEALLLQALDAGYVLFDTAALYGWGANETLVGRALRAHRKRIVLCSKGGMVGEAVDGVMKRVIDGRPEALRRDCEDSLRRLGTEVIDIYYLHRWDQRVPIEDSVGAMSRLVEAGKVRHLGLSEVSAATVRRAHAVHPIVAVQSEYSLWTRNPEIAVLAACREISATLVAFSPTARAFLTGTLRDLATLQPQDLRVTMPRFVGAAWAANLALLPPFEALAAEAGCTPAQLALAWLLAQGEHVLPLPGTVNPDHMRENLAAASLQLDAGMLERAGRLIHRHNVVGARYTPQAQADVDTEDF